MTNKNLVLLLCILIFSSCYKTEQTKEAGCIPPSEEAVVLSATNDLWKSLFSQHTKASAPVVKDVKKVFVNSTKAEQDGSPVYVINFENEQGFSVVHLKNDVASVVAISDNGNINSDYLGAPCFDKEHRELYDLIELSINQVRESPDTTHSSYICEHLEYDPDSVHVSTGEWMLNYNLGPLVPVKWGQGYPFNNRMPILSDDHQNCFSYSSYRGRYPVGCVPIAIAQVMIAANHPSYFVGNIGTYDMADFLTISNYSNYTEFQATNYDVYVDPIREAIVDKATDMLRKIANGVNVIYSCKGTAAITSNAIPYLYRQDPRYYKNGETREIYNMDADNAIILSLMTNEPMIIRSPGHAWVLDGLFHAHRHSADGNVMTKKLYHFNWGWRGYADGYYAFNDFTFANREALADIDTNTALYESTENYYKDGAYVIFFTVYHGN